MYCTWWRWSICQIFQTTFVIFAWQRSRMWIWCLDWGQGSLSGWVRVHSGAPPASRRTLGARVTGAGRALTLITALAVLLLAPALLLLSLDGAARFFSCSVSCCGGWFISIFGLTSCVVIEVELHLSEVGDGCRGRAGVDLGHGVRARDVGQQHCPRGGGVSGA